MSELTPEQISLLADKLLKGTISEAERVLFENWYNTFPEEEVQWEDRDTRSASELKNRIFRRVKMEHTMIRKWYWAAAVFTLLMAGSALLYYNRQAQKRESLAQSTPAVRNVIVPGSNKATLVLANGNAITLDDEENGVLGQQGNTKIIKLNNGQLAFQHGQGKRAGDMASLNTLSTPRGGQYQVTLPDGTVVWINAASKLVFPAAFTGKERVVKLEGEAYFEVAANEHQPFIVKADDMEISVLGTHFNVKAYEEESAMKTTLLEGKVKVTASHREVLLRPGQQAKMNNSGGMDVVAVNVNDVIAWKNGTFSFDDVTIEEVLRQIARWYDVEIVYPDGIPKGLFRGEIDKMSDITTVLKILEVSGVKFTVEGHRILVRP